MQRAARPAGGAITLNNSEVRYTYDALGNKLRKLVSVNNGGSTTTTYLDGFQYENDQLQFFPHPEGYVRATHGGSETSYSFVYQYKDHLGNIRMNYAFDKSDRHVKILKEDHYYPFGLIHKNYNSERRDFERVPEQQQLRIAPVAGTEAYKYKYNGKEWQDELGLNVYDYGARNYDPAIGRWMNIDPLAEQSRRWSPYNYCMNNPVYFIDPDGMSVGDGIFVNEDGKEIGNDGIDDKKVYVVKTTKSNFDSGVASAGITKSQRKETEAFIKANSGNTQAFQDNGIAYNNSVEIIGNQEARQQMENIIMQDDGSRSTADSNNREFGGTVSNSDAVTESTPGPVSDPRIKGGTASISFNINEDTKATFHGHPSGEIKEGGPTNQWATQVAGSQSTSNYNQAPSTGKGADVHSSNGNSTNYVFGRRNNTVYIYNSQGGVQATLPQKYWVNFKK